MHGSERRSHKRYVVDGLMVDIDGVPHETVDVSVRAVAVVRRAGVDYGKIKGPCRFVSAKAGPLNSPILSLHRLYERGPVVVLDYFLGRQDWEAVLTANDVRADLAPLQNVFEE
jgi:hypothetical protein